MIDKIKSSLTNHYLMFLFELGDPQDVKKDALLSKAKLNLTIDKLADRQMSGDLARKRLDKREFKQLLFCYFERFQSSEGIDFKALGKDIESKKAFYSRHVGKEKINYLNLMISISKSLDGTKRGLLGVAS